MIEGGYESLVLATYADEWMRNVLKLIRSQKSDKAKPNYHRLSKTS